jgi:hypothetical protein
MIGIGCSCWALWYVLSCMRWFCMHMWFYYGWEVKFAFLTQYMHMWFFAHEILFVVFALLVCRLLQKATSQESMKHRQLRVLFARLDFQKLKKCHQVIFLHINWRMLFKLVYGQGAIRYKMQYMHYIAYLLYYHVISNCIIAFVAYLVYYRLGHCCCFVRQILFPFLSVCIFSFDIFSYRLIVFKGLLICSQIYMYWFRI